MATKTKRVATHTAHKPATGNALTKSKTVAPPTVGEIWIGQGGRFAGIALSDDGTEDHYLIAYDGLYDGEGNHKAVTKWASKLSADGYNDFTLPTKNESPILYANLKKLFNGGGWYWTSTRCAYDSSYAWCQSFGYGYQYTYHMDYELRGCAVRRIKIIR